MLVTLENRMNATGRETSGVSTTMLVITLDLGACKLNLLIACTAEDNIWSRGKRKPLGGISTIWRLIQTRLIPRGCG